MLRIGVNALYLIPGGVGGTEIYLRNLLPALAEIDSANRYFVFLNRETGTDLVPDRPNFTAVRYPVPARFRPARIIWEQTVLPVSIARLRLDVLFNPGFTSPVICSCRTVTVFHDLQHKRHPEYFRWFDLPFWRILLYAAAQRSSILLADSQATRTDLLRFYRLPAEKIRVVPLGVDPVFFELGRRRRIETRERYILSVSTLHPHKNLDRLIHAFADFRRSHAEFRLVVAGLRGFHAEALERLCASLGVADAVRFTGWIERQELYELFVHASAFLYPSTFEGFGLPVLEALAAGVPTACSNVEPLAGMAGGAALLFDPHDGSAVLDAMVRLTSDADLQARLAAEGPERAAQFSWKKTACATLEALQTP